MSALDAELKATAAKVATAVKDGDCAYCYGKRTITKRDLHGYMTRPCPKCRSVDPSQQGLDDNFAKRWYDPIAA